jgi:lauroyl/myristoyl acyltransferase
MFVRRESPEQWTIEEVNGEEVNALRESERSFIVATGHFRRQSFIALCTSRIVPGATAMVAVPIPERSLNPSDIRLRAHYGQIVKAYKRARPDLKVLFVADNSRKQSDSSLVIQLLGHLAKSRHRVIMAVDAFWRTTGMSSHIRPFCGMKARPFSTGGATLSRLAQCPIVPCVSYVKSNSTIVIEWGPVIAPPPRRDLGADIRTTNVLLDFLENAIGRRPTQYVLDIGDERRFDPALSTWKDLDEKAQ